jgi:hypothetical protein
MMETIEGILQLIEGVKRNGIATRNIAEIEECREAFDGLGGYMACNGSKVDLWVIETG